jgi:hypothetical protein
MNSSPKLILGYQGKDDPETPEINIWDTTNNTFDSNILRDTDSLPPYTGFAGAIRSVAIDAQDYFFCATGYEAITYTSWCFRKTCLFTTQSGAYPTCN